jgi:ribosome-binding ATPase YchF (GTP1/OBG family)
LTPTNSPDQPTQSNRPTNQLTTQQVKELLTNNKPVRDAEWTAKEVELILEKMPTMLTTKPMVYLVNMSAGDFQRKKNKWLPKIHAWVQVRVPAGVRGRVSMSVTAKGGRVEGERARGDRLLRRCGSAAPPFLSAYTQTH